MSDSTYTLVLLRHGESTWNALNQFTGWVDVDLSEKGVAEAVRGGELLRDAGLLPDVVHTSLLRRAIKTSQIALDGCDRHWIPVIRNWRLNERHYGALQGKNKAQTLEAYGEEQFMLWRRSYDTPPPAIDPDDEFSQTHDPRYSWLPPEVNPLTECLEDVVHTSLLRRAIRTSQIALDVADRHWIPVVRNWRLNERHYGALQGKNKK